MTAIVNGYKVEPKANLRRASLVEANLRGANLREADLYGADLREANLCGANLCWANLRWASLVEANLCGANLRESNLRGADLRGADLRGSNLVGADLRGADLRGANLRQANLRGVVTNSLTKLPRFQIPQEGPLTVYKKLRWGVICKLLVPAGAKRTASVVGRKCRAEYVFVLEGEGTSQHDGEIHYKKGLIVRPDKYDDNPLVECAPGIHFFLTRKEAEEY